MSRAGEKAEETSRASGSSQINLTEQRKRTNTIYIVYLIAALDITWMFLQFSVTPVSINAKLEQEAELFVLTLHVEVHTEALILKRLTLKTYNH